MTIPEGASTPSIDFSFITEKTVLAMSTVASACKTCFQAAVSGLTLACAAVKKGITFTATVCAANPKIAKVSKVGLAALLLVGVTAYATRSYYQPMLGKVVK